MENKSYSNKELAEHYFTIISSSPYRMSAINSVPLIGPRYRSQKKTIEKLELSLSNYYTEHKNFDDLDFKSLGLSENTKKTIELILEKSPEYAKKRFFKGKATVNKNAKKQIEAMKNFPPEELYTIHYEDNPLECLLREEQISKVRHVLSRMPNRLQEEALFLSYGHDIEFSVIAEHLGIGYNTVRHLLNIGARKLRRELRREYEAMKNGK